MIVRCIEKSRDSVASILRVERDAFTETLQSRWSVPYHMRHGRVYGLFVDEVLKGFTIFLRSWDDPCIAYLVQIAVQKDYQGNGGGPFLLQESLMSLIKEGITSVTLTVDPRNARALHIYMEKMGFQIADYRHDEYGEWTDRYYLKLDLRGWGGPENVP